MGYTATEHATVADKEKFEKHFKRFVESGFKDTLFPKWFYTRLSMCFGNIAHYDRNNFYEHFFTNAQDQAKFLKQCRSYNCPGDPAYTYSDVEKVLRDWINNNFLFR